MYNHLTMFKSRGGWGVLFTNYLVVGPACDELKWTESDIRFRKNEGSKRYIKTMKKGVNKIGNQEENWYIMLQNGQMTDSGEKLDQL